MKPNKHKVQQKTKQASKPVPATMKKQGFLMRNKELLLLVLVIIVTIAIYYPAVHHQFTNWDDLDYITENPYIKALTPANIHHIFTSPIALNYHPLTMLSLAFNYAISGMEPFSYFLVNILLHICNILLAFYLAFLLLKRNKILALFVAAIFAVHPMHVESVAWIAERKDVLYTFFFLSAMISWIFFIGKRNWKWYLFSLVLFVFAGLSKPSSVVLPLVLLLIDFLHRRKFKLQLIIEIIPFLAFSIWIGMATLHAQLHKAVVDIQYYNFIQQFLFASYGFFIYIFKLIIPVGLSALHPVPVFNNSMDLPAVYFISPFINALIIGFVLYSLKYTRVLFFGLLFYFLNIVLTLQFMQVGSAVIAERYTYVSYIGLLIGLAWLMDYTSGLKKIPMTWFYPVIIILFCVFTFLSAGRVSVWKNSETLWSDVIAKYPKSHLAYSNRGYYYVKENMLEKALPDFTRSIELMPTFIDALNNRGSLYRLQNKYRLAVNDYNRALSINPDYVKALSGRGQAYFELNILDSALADFNKAYQTDPELAISLGNRGGVYFRLGQYDNAVEECNRVIAHYPDNTEAHLNRGVSYSSLQKWDPAINDYTYVINAKTKNPMVFEWRGVAYRSKGMLQEAIRDFSAGIAMSPSTASLYVNRAMAYKKAGMYQKASDDVKTARQLGANVTE